MKQKKLIFNFFVNRNWKKLTDSRKRAKILADNRKSHHPIETLCFPSSTVFLYHATVLCKGPIVNKSKYWALCKRHSSIEKSKILTLWGHVQSFYEMPPFLLSNETTTPPSLSSGDVTCQVPRPHYSAQPVCFRVTFSERALTEKTTNDERISVKLRSTLENRSNKKGSLKIINKSWTKVPCLGWSYPFQTFRAWGPFLESPDN